MRDKPSEFCVRTPTELRLGWRVLNCHRIRNMKETPWLTEAIREKCEREEADRAADSQTMLGFLETHGFRCADPSMMRPTWRREWLSACTKSIVGVEISHTESTWGITLTQHAAQTVAARQVCIFLGHTESPADVLKIIICYSGISTLES